MFDDLNNKNNTAGVNDQSQNNAVAQPGLTEAGKSPTAAEDIFAEVEKNDKPWAFRPRIESNLPHLDKQEQIASQESKKFLYIFIGLIAIVLLLVVGFFIFNYYTGNNSSAGDLIDEQNMASETSETSLGTEIDTNQTESETATGQDTVEQDTVETEAVVQLVDTDQDGLTDEEEKIIGININSSDTDKDGLFDREEVKVYLTDPLNSDTDNDNYLDGDEVKNGYNPNGSGRLY